MTQLIDAPLLLGAADKSASLNSRTARIALLGCGTIGREVARMITESKDRIQPTAGIRLELISVLIRDSARRRDVDRSLLTTDFQRVLDHNPDMVIEALGGVEPAASYVHAALERGISVVTANKSLIAWHGSKLRATARRHGAALECEASVAAAVPVLATMRQLAGDHISSIRAVLNGTCNYILTRMSEAKLSLDEALAEAIDRGFAEPDPSADLCGRDSAEKLCVLAAAIGYEGFTPDLVAMDGIADVSIEDISAARAHGFVVKLVAELQAIENGLSLSVRPTLVPRHHALARPRGAENAVLIDSRRAGSLFLAGPGAGPQPTASAILGDVLRVLNCDSFCPPQTGYAPDGIARSIAPPARQCFLRIRDASEPLRPNHANAALRAHGVCPRHIEFRTDSMNALTEDVEFSRVAVACSALAREAHGRSFVAPLL